MTSRATARKRWLAFGFGLVLVANTLAAGCRGRSTNEDRPSNAATHTRSTPISTLDARRETAPSGSSRILLGRVVALDGPRSVRTLTDAPDQEATDVDDGVAIVLREDSTLQGFRLSTGEPLWTQVPRAPCRKLMIAKSMVYTGCGNKVFSFAAATGKQQLVDGRTDALDPLLDSAGEVVVVPGGSGRANLYEAGSNRLLASKVIPELARAFDRHVLANPASGGVCAVGLVAASAALFSYRAGCYDANLTQQWTRSFSFPRRQAFDIRQLGPRFLVLDDQYSVEDPSQPPGPGRGLVLRWRDGQQIRFDDKTFATLEDNAGERLSPETDIFSMTRTLPITGQTPFSLREAKVVSDRDHVFALIVNGSTALAGIERSTGHVLFLVPVSLDVVWDIDLVGGMPTVRTRDSGRWTATIFDPRTGDVRYRDSRPRARAY